MSKYPRQKICFDRQRDQKKRYTFTQVIQELVAIKQEGLPRINVFLLVCLCRMKDFIFSWMPKMRNSTKKWQRYMLFWAMIKLWWTKAGSFSFLIFIYLSCLVKFCRSRITIICAASQSQGTGEGKRGDWICVGPGDDMYTVRALFFKCSFEIYKAYIIFLSICTRFTLLLLLLLFINFALLCGSVMLRYSKRRMLQLQGNLINFARYCAPPASISLTVYS